ncbi:MAG: hypothetical protein WCP32_02450 [Bacteroidota bacterium]
MKKLACIFSAMILFAFLFNATTQAQNIFPASGKVGIGTVTPLYELQVTTGNTGAATSITVEKVAGAGGAQFIMKDVAQNIEWRFKSAAGGLFKIRDNVHTSDVVVFEAVPTNAATALYLKANGNLGIGTTNPLAKLSVNGTGTFNGKVKCTEIEVLTAAFPDYVFKAGYNLRPLSEVESFINLNKHLPDVPSEATVLANGLNLGEMNTTLLQKVEELTLYMIQLQKDNDALKTRISNLEK